MSIGTRIKSLRLEKGLTQKQLGDLCGMADSAIRRYESDKGNPTEKTINRIADALGVSSAYLHGWDEAVSNLEAAGMSVNDVAEELNIPVEALMDIVNRRAPNSYEATDKIIKVACLLLEAAKKEGGEEYSDDSFITSMMEKLSKGASFRKMSDAEAHKAGFLKFNGEDDRIAHFYSKLNTDGKLVASKHFYKNLDESKLAEVADYVEKLSETPQYQRTEQPEDPPEDK